MGILARVKRFLRNVRDVSNRVDAVIQRLDKFTTILEGLENQSQMFGHKLDSSIECLNNQAKTLSKNFQTLAHGLEDQSRGLKATVGFQKTLVMMQREQRELIEDLARVIMAVPLEREFEEGRTQVSNLRQCVGVEGEGGTQVSNLRQRVGVEGNKPISLIAKSGQDAARDLYRTNDAQQVALNSTISQNAREVFYVAYGLHEHDRLYSENLHEFFAESGISATTILLGDPADGNRPQLAESLSEDALGIIGFNSQLDHSYIGSTPFVQLAAEHRVPVIQWILDHPSSRLSEFGNSSAENSRFLFSSSSAEAYFRRFGLKNALTATVACVGPSRHSRAKNLTFHDFSNRPIAGMVAMNLIRIGGTIDDAWERVHDLEPRLRQVVEQTVDHTYLDLIEPLEAHFEKALADIGLVISDMDRHACMQMVEEIVQVRRRQKILQVARDFPLLIQSDAASRPFRAGAKASFKESQDSAVTWARLKLTRAQVCISNMHDMVHDRILNGLNAGCLNVVEDSNANRRVFEHGRDALFFRYSDDSLRECLELVCSDLYRSYDIAAAGFARRDNASFRFGNFQNIINLARQPFPD